MENCLFVLFVVFWLFGNSKRLVLVSGMFVGLVMVFWIVVCVDNEFRSLSSSNVEKIDW